MRTGKPPLADPSAAPPFTANLVVAWISFAVLHVIVSIFSPHAANPIVSWALWLIWAVVTPTVLCGLVVWVGQRRSRIRYPAHAGEWLWNVHAVAVCLWFVLQIPVFVMQVLERLEVIQVGRSIATVSFSGFIIVNAIHALLALILVFAIREGRWKFYTLTFAVGMASRVVANALMIADLWSESFRSTGLAPAVLTLSVLPVIPLIVVMIADVVERKRYPWTHWTGAALQGCNHMLILAYVVTGFLQIV